MIMPFISSFLLLKNPPIAIENADIPIIVFPIIPSLTPVLLKIKAKINIPINEIIISKTKDLPKRLNFLIRMWYNNIRSNKDERLNLWMK